MATDYNKLYISTDSIRDDSLFSNLVGRFSINRCYEEDLSTKYSLRSIVIKKVIFNDPATIVLWADGTKTVVKADPNEIFDEEKGLAMAIAKKALGNKGNYYNTFRTWLPKGKENLAGFIQRVVYDNGDPHVVIVTEDKKNG